MIVGRFCETPVLQRTARIFEKVNEPTREIGKIDQQICSETGERNLRRRQNEHHAEQQHVHQIDHDQREERTLIAQVSLIFRNHPTRKREMERPRRADHSVKPPAVRLYVYKKTERSIDRDRQNAVKWKKIWRQRDPEVGLVGNYMAAVTAHAKPAHAPTHQPNPQRVGQFVSEDINEDWAGKTEKSNQPQNCAQ
jgi:hypothetical protein